MPIDMPRGLPFAVDTWGPSSRHRRHRFLTHAHRDHLVGAGAGTGDGGTVYATRLTLALALRHFPQLESWEFVEMEVGRTVAVDDPAGAFSVTAYDANLCPGAVMFLFEGQFGTILHTGDCRLTSDCVQNLPLKYIMKKGNENVCRLDFVFLDCTFSKCFLKLPSKESAIQQVMECIWKHPHAPFVYLACDLLGHEDILVEVSRTFGLKIYVDRKLDCFKALSLTAPEIITDDPSSRFQMVGFHQLYDKASIKLEEARASLQPEPLFIRPSTQWYAIGARSQKPSLTEAEQDEFGIWHICFSIHSSRDELEQALQLLQPQWVISTTPPWFAIELSYVKKHCFKSRLTADDPLRKIFRDPLQKSVSSPCLVLPSETYTDKDHSDFVDGDDLSLPSSEDCTYLNVSTLELKFVPSPPPEEPEITLFGKARFGSQAIDIMREELCNQHITVEEGCLEEARACAPADLVRGNSEDVETNPATDCVMKHALASHQDHVETGPEVGSCQHEASSWQLEASQAQSLPTVRRNILVPADQHGKLEGAMESKSISSEDSSLSMVRSGDTTNCQKEPLCTIGSSKCLGPSLKRLYRSRNIPVPRPLPSLVRLFESTKRVKMQPSTNYSSLNSRHSLP
ncbi:hypothetical protein HU200_067073 [Digitaria exilis]|uniref:DNA repair metallo-beta-lactamase domain-containing protein n=1 Tax=Digitaria exilis TaxID=1010633 RepID=A0A835DWI7_9POAL|nr:hypothetical protein HU200_067073 [Digitaria exilis]